MKLKKTLSVIIVLLLILLCSCSNSTITENIPPEIESAVARAILNENKAKNTQGECPAEGHIIFSIKPKDDAITVYSYIAYACFGFENGNFVDISGAQLPAVFKFNADDYSLIDVSYPEDGTFYVSSIKNLFPTQYEKMVLNLTESDYANLDNQLNRYAEDYLKSIGRTAPIGRMIDFEYTLPTDIGVNVDVSNKLAEKAKYLNNYPYWIGNCEIIEDDIRYVYETAYDKEKNLIIYTKYSYNNPKIIEEKIVINSLNGDIIETV